MPTLDELRAANRETAQALRDAEDRIGRARDRARDSVMALATLESRAIGGETDEAALAAARAERAEAMGDLKTISDELRPADR